MTVNFVSMYLNHWARTSLSLGRYNRLALYCCYAYPPVSSETKLLHISMIWSCQSVFTRQHRASYSVWQQNILLNIPGRGKSPSIIMDSMSRSVTVGYLWGPVVQSWGWWHCPEAQCWCQAPGCCWWATWGQGWAPRVVFSGYKHTHWDVLQLCTSLWSRQEQLMTRDRSWLFLFRHCVNVTSRNIGKIKNKDQVGISEMGQVFRYIIRERWVQLPALPAHN